MLYIINTHIQNIIENGTIYPLEFDLRMREHALRIHTHTHTHTRIQMHYMHIMLCWMFVHFLHFTLFWLYVFIVVVVHDAIVCAPFSS